MKSYGQYCPIARTSELFAERWTPIILRNLGGGCVTFTQIREGAPGIPKALLAARLSQLEHHGIIAAERRPKARGHLYSLTRSGRELKAVCDAMGNWGARWLEIEPHHLDPAYALWATCRLVDIDAVPPKGVVIRVHLREEPRKQFWMILKRPRAELCSSYPGSPEDLTVTTDAKTIALWNLRRVSFTEAERDGSIVIEGPPRLARSFQRWVRPSPFAGIPQA